MSLPVARPASAATKPAMPLLPVAPPQEAPLVAPPEPASAPVTATPPPAPAPAAPDGPMLRLTLRDSGPTPSAPLAAAPIAAPTPPPNAPAPKETPSKETPQSAATDRLLQLIAPAGSEPAPIPVPIPAPIPAVAVPPTTQLEPVPALPTPPMVAKIDLVQVGPERLGPGEETPITTALPPPAPPPVPQTAPPPPPVAAPPAQNWPAMTLRLRTTSVEQAGFGPGDAPLRVAPLLAADRSDVPGTSAGGKLILQEPPKANVVDLGAPQATEIAYGPPLDLPALETAPDALTPGLGRPTNAFAAQAAPPRPAPPPPPIFAPRGDEPETLSMAILSAMEMNPEIQIAEAQRDDALYGVDEARAAMLPSVNLSASQGRERRTTQDESENEGNNTRTEIVISARQNLFDFGASNETLRSAENGAESAEWSYRAQADQVGMKIAQTFHMLAERQAIVELAEKNVEAHEAILRTVKAQRDFGMVTGADVSRIEARLNAARQELLDRKSQLDQAREEYRRLLNRAPGRVQIPPGVEGQIPSDVEDAVKLLEDANPQIMQARRLMESLQRQRSAQRAGGLPRVDLELEGASRNNVGGETGRAEEARAMVAMRMPLFDGGARQAAVNRITARMRQAEFQVERARRDAEQSLRNDYTALTAAKAKIESIEAEVAAGERLVVLYQEQFKNGSRSVFDLLDSQQTLYTAQVKRESNRTEVRLSSYRVLSTLGSLVTTVTKADNVNVRLFPAEEASSVRGGRPISGISPR